MYLISRNILPKRKCTNLQLISNQYLFNIQTVGIVRMKIVLEAVLGVFGEFNVLRHPV